MAEPDLTNLSTAFGSLRVVKDDKLEKEIKELPEELRRLWIERNFQQFLREFNTILEKLNRPGNSVSEKGTEISDFNSVLHFLSEPGKSDAIDHEIHQLINDCYSSCEKYLAGKSDDDLQRRLASSCNRYVINVLCTERMEFAPSDCTGRYLALSKHLLTEPELKKQTLNVEDTLSECRKPQGAPSGSENEYILQRISLEFMNKLYIYPLDSQMSTFPKHPGVYFIYYVGCKKRKTRELYKGSKIISSTDQPVYVGMSETSICSRLINHQGKIKKAKNLKLGDFVVRFIIVDIKYYARCIEGMLIEHFSPVWNSESVGFSFGNGNNKKNTWNKYHIQEHGRTIKTMLARLRK